MEKMKTTVFGGYKRAEVDAKFWDLQKRAEKAEADFARATSDCETLQQTAADLRRELFAQEERNAQLQSDLETARTKVPENDRIIGKVYLHAYETGAEIAGTARDGANSLKTEVDTAFTENKAELNNAAEKLSVVGEEIAQLIEQMNEKTARLQDILSSFRQKVADISVMYDGVAAVQNQTDERINAAVSEYETSARSFLELIREKEQPEQVEGEEKPSTIGNFHIIETNEEPDESPAEAPVIEFETEPESEEPAAETSAPQEENRPAFNIIQTENDYPVPPAVAQARAIVEQATAIFENTDLPKPDESAPKS